MSEGCQRRALDFSFFALDFSFCRGRFYFLVVLFK